MYLLNCLFLSSAEVNCIFDPLVNDSRNRIINYKHLMFVHTCWKPVTVCRRQWFVAGRCADWPMSLRYGKSMGIYTLLVWSQDAAEWSFCRHPNWLTLSTGVSSRANHMQNVYFFDRHVTPTKIQLEFSRSESVRCMPRLQIVRVLVHVQVWMCSTRYVRFILKCHLSCQ